MDVQIRATGRKSGTDEAPAFDPPAAVEHQLNRFRVDAVLLGQNARRQRIAGVVITNFDGKDVDDVERFRLLVADTPVNKKVKVNVLRSGQPRDLYVTLSERPKDEVLQKQAQPKFELGLRVESLSSETARSLDIKDKSGVVVVDVSQGGAADDAGLQRGDVIKEVNDQSVKDVTDYNAAVTKARDKNPAKPIVFLIKRGDATRFLAVQPDED